MRYILFNLMILFVCSGCAPKNGELIADPFESINRPIFDLNVKLMERTSTDYKAPSTLHRTLTRFTDNLHEPINVVHDLMQGNIRYALSDTGRFVINSTLGLAGFLDPATELTLPKHHQTLGKTMYRWGFKHSPYLMLPALGPSTVLDTSANALDTALLMGASQNATLPAGLYPSGKLGQLITHNGVSPIILIELAKKEDPYAFVREEFYYQRQYDYDNSDVFLDDREALIDELIWN